LRSRSRSRWSGHFLVEPEPEPKFFGLAPAPAPGIHKKCYKKSKIFHTKFEIELKNLFVAFYFKETFL
jgi:hypothetical protein